MGVGAAPDIPDDDTLVVAAQIDPAAFANLYERYHGDIYRFVLGKVADAHQAEDITSQVFLRAMRGLSTFQTGSFRGWLYQIARNAIIDSYRRQRPAVPGERLLGVADPEPGPLATLEAREARQEMDRILEQLTGPQRDIIHLRLRGYSGQDIATELGLSIGAVKSAQFRAFEKIRRLMLDAASADDPAAPGRP